jgi:beta-carotene 3-hydroxylase
MTLNPVIIILSFTAMELVAWLSHKFIMHGFLWYLHRDHHKPDSMGFFEKNDLFFLIFAVPSCLCIMFGAIDGFDFKFYIGMGILLYGIAYFLVHDVIIHRRFKWFSHSGSRYVQGIQKAHWDHHQTAGRYGNKNFGMLLVSYKYFKAELNS